MDEQWRSVVRMVARHSMMSTNVVLVWWVSLLLVSDLVLFFDLLCIRSVWVWVWFLGNPCCVALCCVVVQYYFVGHGKASLVAK